MIVPNLGFAASAGSQYMENRPNANQRRRRLAQRPRDAAQHPIAVQPERFQEQGALVAKRVVKAAVPECQGDR